MRKIKVSLNNRSYEILIGNKILDNLLLFLKQLEFSKIVLISDVFVDSIYGHLIKKILKPYKVITIVIPQGEQFKTLYTASAIYDQMIKAQVGRDSVIISLGGGVISDLAGFVAATYMRGIRFICVPTTLLAQVDASIGGKTGVDHALGKNLIGAFYQPKFVLVDTEFLRTLQNKEIKTGLSEIVKYGIIKDPKIFEMLESNPKATSGFWENIITRCTLIKASVVSKDEKEMTGLRMVLNFGHTFGHAIETITKYKRYTHGEAVALGMVAASYLSCYMKLLKRSELERITSLISKLKLPIRTNLKNKNIVKALLFDKKAKAGKVRFVLPIKIGEVVISENISSSMIKKALKEIGCK